ncbi:MAG: hypothetical protein HOQ09_02650 [Gemmatimonadaceae bacterium]|nr:hypothetical protein [Gemmatimonadaceae bacterium]
MNPSTLGAPPERESRGGYSPPVARDTRQLLSAVRELILGQWRIAAAVVVVIVAIAVTVLLLTPRRYTSDASFIVEAPNGAMGGAMAIISQLNPNLAGGDSPKFYVDLVQSRPVLESILRIAPKEQCGAAGARTVEDRLKPAGDNDIERMAAAVLALSGRVGAGYDLRTGVISVSVEADCPMQARELTDSLIAAVNAFNVERRQTRAKLRREFSERQANEADAALRSAENDFAQFLATNRMIVSPQLKMENDRLQRRVSMREEVASALRRDATSARMDEINSLPALTVIEPPSVPIHASYPKRRLIAIAAAGFGLALGLAAALLVALLRPLPADSSAEAARFHDAARALISRTRRS